MGWQDLAAAQPPQIMVPLTSSTWLNQQDQETVRINTKIVCDAPSGHRMTDTILASRVEWKKLRGQINKTPCGTFTVLNLKQRRNKSRPHSSGFFSFCYSPSINACLCPCWRIWCSYHQCRGPSNLLLRLHTKHRRRGNDWNTGVPPWGFGSAASVATCAADLKATCVFHLWLISSHLAAGSIISTPSAKWTSSAVEGRNVSPCICPLSCKTWYYWFAWRTSGPVFKVPWSQSGRDGDGRTQTFIFGLIFLIIELIN